METTRQSWSRAWYKVPVLITIIGAFVAINIWVIAQPEIIASLSHVGLIGLFVLSVISGFNVVVPIPVSVLFPTFMTLGYPAALIIILIACGMTCGDILGYVLGRTSRSMIGHAVWNARVERYIQRHPSGIFVGVLLYAAAVPLPNELIVIPLASLGVSWQRVIIPVCIGNMILTTVIALGAHHITALFVS